MFPRLCYERPEQPRLHPTANEEQVRGLTADSAEVSRKESLPVYGTWRYSDGRWQNDSCKGGVQAASGPEPTLARVAAARIATREGTFEVSSASIVQSKVDPVNGTPNGQPVLYLRAQVRALSGSVTEGTIKNELDVGVKASRFSEAGSGCLSDASLDHFGQWCQLGVLTAETSNEEGVPSVTHGSDSTLTFPLTSGGIVSVNSGVLLVLAGGQPLAVSVR
jgi:hypothetical protein